MTAIFLQVRLDSSRLPNKALLRLGDRTVIEHAMRALDGVAVDRRCLLTTGDSAEALKFYAGAAGWELFTGPKDDVLGRFTLAARKYRVNSVIRATGDNPLVSATMAQAALTLSQKTGAAYAGFKELPPGSGIEVLDTRALETAHSEAEDPYEREHVSPFLYRRPERFRIEVASAPFVYRFPEARITLDTVEDFTYLEHLYSDLYAGESLDLDRVVPWLRENRRNAG